MSVRIVPRGSRLPTWWTHGAPLAALREEVDDLFHRFVGTDEGEVFAREPNLDLVETDKNLEVRVDVPGYQPDEIDVQVRGDVLTIRGETKEEKEEEKREVERTYHVVERRLGRFSRLLTLPCPVDEEGVKARCERGVLTIMLPKVEEARSHKIKITKS